MADVHQHAFGGPPCLEDHPEDGAFTHPRVIAERLRACAAGRREYARSCEGTEDGRALLVEAATFESAAEVAEGSLEPLYGALPSWRWTPEMHAALDGDGAAG